MTTMVTRVRRERDSEVPTTGASAERRATADHRRAGDCCWRRDTRHSELRCYFRRRTPHTNADAPDEPAFLQIHFVYEDLNDFKNSRQPAAPSAETTRDE
jgi:hypothetical protein